MKLAFFAVFRGHLGKMLGFGRGKFACGNQDLQKVVLAFRIGALPLVKQIGHTVNLVQKNFVGERRKRYILDKVLVKQFFQPIGRDIPFLEDIAEHAQHFRPVGPLAKRRGGAVLDREELFQFHQVDIQLVVGNSAVPVEPHMVQVGVLFPQELVFGQDREHVDVRQPVGLRLLDRAGNHPRRIVDEPVNKELVVALLDLDKDGVARLRRAVDVENGGLVVQDAGVLLDAQGERPDCVCTREPEHGVQELHRPFRLRFVGHEHLEDSVAERVDVPVDLAVFRQVFGMLVHVLGHGEEFTAVHVSSFVLGGEFTNCSPGRVQTTVAFLKGGPALPRRHALFCGATLRLAARAPLTKPSLAPLAVIPAHHHVIPAQAGISLLVPRVSAPTRPLGVKSGRSHLVSPRSHLKVAMTTKATSCQVVKARQHDSLRRVAYGSRGNDRCRETLEEAC